MARSRSINTLIAIALSVASAASVVAQTPTSTTSPTQSATSPSSTITPASSVASAAVTASTSSDIPLSLWAIANSLLTSYYPSSSTTITQVDSLTWPSTVVIGSQTYSVTPSATGSAATSVLAEQTGAPSSTQHHGLRSDEKLGIVIGVVVGGVALAVLALVFCCLHRRKKATGAYFMRRPTPSISDSDIEGWRSPLQPERSTMSSGPSQEWTEAEKYNRMSAGPAPGAAGLMQPPPMAMHPAFARHYSYSNRSMSEDNPFFTPQERSEHYEMDGADVAGAHKEMGDADSPIGRTSSESIRRDSRPPTPFNPMLAMMSGAQPTQHYEQHQQQQQEHHNPFSSPEDDEMDDVISPIIPARSPERRHSPMVHYPSWGEVSEFDFSGEGGPKGRPSIRGQSSSESGSDGWRPQRESVIGRTELA